MNRNQRIVVSIIGIIIVTLALIGITYAYFLTKIIGNSTSTSISGTLADLELTYGDGNGVIAPTDPIMPNTTLTPKEFTVKNTGSVKVENYAVVFENLTNTLTRKEDLVYTLECSSDDNNPCNGVDNIAFPSTNGSIILNTIEPTVTHSYTLTITYKNLENVNQSDDMGATFSAKVNIMDGKEFGQPIKTVVLTQAKNATGETTGETFFREKPLTEPALNVSHNFNCIEKESEEFTFVPQDYGLAYADSYSKSTQSTSLSLIDDTVSSYNSSYSNLNGKYMTFYNMSWGTTSEIFEVIDAKKDKLTLKRHEIVYESKESTLSQISDLYGTSYYYRGEIEDNYLTFNNMCWRIVRIQGDGSTKITLYDAYSPCERSHGEGWAFIGEGSYGYNGTGYSNNKADYLNCTSNSGTCMKNKFDTWFNENFKNVKDKLKEETWYLGSTTNTYKKSSYSYYEAGQRLNGYGTTRGVSLLSKTNGFKSYIGALTADEVALAGAKTHGDGDSYQNIINNNYYLYIPDYSYLTMSLDYRYGNQDNAFSVEGYISGANVYSSYFSLRPVIVLASNVTVTGQGTKSDPYIVK